MKKDVTKNLQKLIKRALQGEKKYEKEVVFLNEKIVAYNSVNGLYLEFSSNIKTENPVSVSLEDFLTISEEDKITIENNKITIENNGIIKTISGVLDNKILNIQKHLKSSDEHNIPEDITFTPEKIKELKVMAKFTSTDKLRPERMGVNLSTEGIAATDGYVLRWNNDIKTKNTNGIIPTEIIKMLDDKINAKLSFSKSKSIFNQDNFCFIIKNESGKYPNYQNRIPASHSVEASFSKKEILSALESVSGIYIEIDIYFGKNEMYLQAINRDTENKAVARIPAVSDNDFLISLAPERLTSCIKSISGDEIIIKASDPNRAIIINDNVLLMPRLNATREENLENIRETIKNSNISKSKTKNTAPSSGKIAQSPAKPAKIEKPAKVIKLAEKVAPVAPVETVKIQGITLEIYSKKAIAVFGETKPYREIFKSLHGRFNPNLLYNNEKTPGWVFSKKREEEVRAILQNIETVQK